MERVPSEASLGGNIVDPIPLEARVKGATHYIKRILDPTEYIFHFSINGK